MLQALQCKWRNLFIFGKVFSLRPLRLCAISQFAGKNKVRAETRRGGRETKTFYHGSHGIHRWKISSFPSVLNDPIPSGLKRRRRLQVGRPTMLFHRKQRGTPKKRKFLLYKLMCNFTLVASVSDHAIRSLTICRLPGGSQAGPGCTRQAVFNANEGDFCLKNP